MPGQAGHDDVMENKHYATIRYSVINAKSYINDYRPTMKCAIITPPYIRPTSPPLGPAVLASYLKKNNPFIQVRNFDLNLAYYSTALKAVQDGSVGIRLYNWDEKTTAIKVMGAVEFLKSWDGADPDLKLYHHWATVFQSFENIMNTFMSEMAQRWLFGLEISNRIKMLFQDIVRPVLKFEPDLTAISVLFDHQMVFATLLAKMIRERHTTKIVLGGAKLGVMAHPERLFLDQWNCRIDQKDLSLKLTQMFDFLCPGEGEIALLSLCEKINSDDLIDVPNLIWRMDGNIQMNPFAIISDLNEIPEPDFDDFDLKNYINPVVVLPLLASRGCPWAQCTFCTHHHSYLKFRMLKIDECIRHLKALKERYQANYFYFYDEMISANRFRELADKLIDEDMGIYYGAYAKPVSHFDGPLLKQIYQSGCRVLLWGVESASQRVLNLMRKGTKVHDMEKVLRESGRAGIMNLVFIMFGFPTETEEEFWLTVDFLDQNDANIHALSKGKFMLTQGSLIHRNPGQFSITAIREKPYGNTIEKVLDYDVAKGLAPSVVTELYKNSLKHLHEIGLSSCFGCYREHLLVHAARKIPAP